MADPPNVLLVVLDSVRADRLETFGHDSETMPTLDELASRGSVFREAYATGPWTAPVHASLFTGLLPHEHGTNVHRPTFNPGTDVLAEQLSDAGYDTVAITANPWLTESFGFDRGFDRFTSLPPRIPFEDAGDPREQGWDYTADRIKRFRETLEWLFDGHPVKRAANKLYVERLLDYPVTSGSKLNEAVERWLSNRESTDPFFLFMNYMDAHEPYRIRKEHLDTEVDPTVTDFSWNHDTLKDPPTPELARDLERVYEASLSALDDHLNNLINRLRREDVLDETLILLVGDHGQALGEQGYWGHGLFLFESLIKVPLVIVAPEESMLPGPEVTRPVSVSWIPEYLTEVAASPRRGSGDTLWFPGLDGDPRPVIAESYGIDEGYADRINLSPSTLSPKGYTAVIGHGWKGVHNRTTDEFELVPIDTEPPVDRSEAKKLLETELPNIDLPSDDTDSNEREVDAEVEKRLKRLGYK